MKELKPCPFDGHTNIQVFIENKDDGGYVYSMVCTKCMAKALYAHTWKSKTPMVRVQNWEIGVTDQNKKKYLGLAKAALNALLGE